MDLSGRPLLDTRTDAALLADCREPLARLHAALDAGLNALLVGPRGAGRSTILRALARERRERNETGAVPVAVVVGAGCAGPGALLAAVTRALGGSGAPLDDPMAALAALAEAAERTGTVEVMLDDAPVAAAHALFGALRDELWAIGLRWAVGCVDTDEAGLLRPPADAFFEVVVRLEPLAPAAARDLLERRGVLRHLDGDVVDELVEAAAGHPRRLLDLSRAVLVEGGDPHALVAATRQRRRRAAELGRPAALALDALESVGAASASDTALLDRLHWTRSRAVQVLGVLEQAGLVTAADVRDGRGRPRRVFRPTPLVDSAP